MPKDQADDSWRSKKWRDEKSVTPNSSGATGEPLKKSQRFRILPKSQAELLRLFFSCVYFLLEKVQALFLEDTRETFLDSLRHKYIDTSHEGRRTESIPSL